MSYVSMLGALSFNADGSIKVSTQAGAQGRTIPSRSGESLVDGGDHSTDPKPGVAVTAASTIHYAPPTNMGTPGMMYTTPAPAPAPVPAPKPSAAVFERNYTVKPAPGPTTAGSHSGALLVFGILGAVAVAWLVTRDK